MVAMSHKSHRRRLRFKVKRRGSIIVLTAVLMIVFCACLALSVDVGYMCSARTDFQRSLDAGALAGAGAIVNGTNEARHAVRDFIQRNPIGTRQVDQEEIHIQLGHWNPLAQTFLESDELPSAIRVTATARNLPHFFGRVFNRYTFDLDGEAVAMFQPREVAIVLDYSGSMNDDSELRNIGNLGRAAVEANLFQIYEELGAPTFGNMQWEPVYIYSNYTSVVMNTLGLNGVPYPYPSGSWSDYIYYVKNDYYINNAGYRKDYGYLTLVNYWLQKKPRNDQTPDLWQTSEQPITAVKDGLQLYLAYLQEVDTDDRAALIIYTHPSGGAIVETGLTDDFQLVEDLARQRQAAHYDNMTNIAAGLREAREELEDHARAGAFKLIVLMTDGVANRPDNSTVAREMVLDEAAACAANHYPVITISLGANADTGLMQTVADTTGGIHYNIPGGCSVSEYEEDLKDVFRAIADHRPLKLVK
jgi:hypothetical protein